MPLCAGIYGDLRGRLPYYFDDWRQGLSFKCLSATLYIFFTNVLPAMSFASLLSARTGGTLGVAEVLLSMGLGGLLFAFFAGQPLVIVGVTGCSGPRLSGLAVLGVCVVGSHARGSCERQCLLARGVRDAIFGRSVWYVDQCNLRLRGRPRIGATVFRRASRSSIIGACTRCGDVYSGTRTRRRARLADAASRSAGISC